MTAIQYSESRDCFVRSIEDHAKSTTKSLLTRVKRSRATGDVLERIIFEHVVNAIECAYKAGDREGASRTEAQLSETVNALVTRAIAGITLEGARCPHCVSGCVECGDTGKRR